MDSTQEKKRIEIQILVAREDSANRTIAQTDVRREIRERNVAGKPTSVFEATDPESGTAFACIVKPRSPDGIPLCWLVPKDLSYVALLFPKRFAMECEGIGEVDKNLRDSEHPDHRDAWNALEQFLDPRDDFEKIWTDR